ncbi:MAG: response regulator, partial [Rubrivivax sp.]
MLERMGFHCESVDSGEAALGAVGDADAEGRPFEGVLLDWQMPGLDGMQAAARLQELQLRHRPMLMLVTAFGRDEALARPGSQGLSAV